MKLKKVNEMVVEAIGDGAIVKEYGEAIPKILGKRKSLGAELLLQNRAKICDGFVVDAGLFISPTT